MNGFRRGGVTHTHQSERVLFLVFTLKICLVALLFEGEVPEWSNGLAWRASVPSGTGGSNPSLSATGLTYPSFFIGRGTPKWILR